MKAYDATFIHINLIENFWTPENWSEDILLLKKISLKIRHKTHIKYCKSLGEEIL